MSYTITKTAGGTVATVTDGSLDTTTLDIALIGKNYTNYGQSLNENFVKMLENFANTTQPSQPMTGQFWYDSGNKLPKVYTGTAWKNIGSATADGSAPTGANVGDLWYDTTNKQLKTYNGSGWDLIGPDWTGDLGLYSAGYRFGQEVAKVSDGVTTHAVVNINAGGQVVAIFSGDAAFTPSPAITGFATIEPGLNLNSTLNAKVANADLLDGLDSTQFMRSDTNTGTSGNLAITNATASTSSSTGALKVSGGAGVSGNVYAGGNIVATGNLTGTNISGTLSTAAQPNVTSVGTLTGLTVSGTATATTLAGTLSTAAQPNVTSLGTLTSLAVTGNVAAGNLSGTSIVGTLTTAAQTNITSLGTLSSLTVSGNIASGNLSAGIVTSASGTLTLTPATTLQITKSTSITDTTDAASLSTGALVVSGGVAVQGKLRANIGLYTDNLYYANGVAYGSSSGTVNSGTANRLAYYVSTGAAVSQTPTNLTYDGTTLRAGYLAANVGYSPTLALTYGSTINWNTANGQTARVTLTGNATMATPTNLLDGGFYTVMVIQDSTGNRTLSWSANYKWIGGSSPDLSTTAGAVDFFSFFSDGTYMYEQGRAQEVA
jgi:hypothetical protein